VRKFLALYHFAVERLTRAAKIYVRSPDLLPWRALQFLADTVNEDPTRLVGIVVVGLRGGVVNQLVERWVRSKGRDMVVVGATPLVA